MSRRNDRGYNSDMDGGGRGRGGSMRGRGRGRGGGPGRQNDSRYNTGSTISDFVVNNVDKRKPLGNVRGPTTNGRPPRGGPGGDRNSRPNRGSGGGRLSLDSAGGGDRDRK